MENKNSLFPISTVNLLKAVCAIVIVVHHSSFYLPDSIFASVFRPCGYLPVGIFLFISGFGLVTSLYTKEKYLESFFKRRIPQILVPAIICLLLYLVFIKEHISLVSFLEGQLPFSHYWYIIVIFSLYLLFYFVFSIIDDRLKAQIVTFVILNIYIVVGMLLGIGSYWYYTIWAYAGGGFLAIIENDERGIHTLGYIRAHRRILFYVLFLIFIFSTILKHTRISLGIDFPGFGVLLTLLSSLSLPLALCLSISANIKNQIINFLAIISYELYLIHNLIVYMYNKTWGINCIYEICFILFFSIIAAYVIKQVDKRLLRIIR